MSLVNRDGTVAGGNLTVTTSGAIDNQRGLPQARRHADADGFEPDNSDKLDRQQRARQGRAGQGGQYRGRAREQPGRRDQRRPGFGIKNRRAGQRCWRHRRARRGAHRRRRWTTRAARSRSARAWRC
ncbi:hypothetical protein WJ968_08140 [Achromobacter xylosoxidans]